VVDGTDRTVLSQMSVGIAPRTLAWHAGTDSVYVMAQTGASSAPTLYVIDGTSPFDSVYNQSTTILGAAGTQPGFVTVDEQNDRIYAGLSTGFVVRLQASTKTIIDSVAVGTSPQGIAVNPATRTVYVADIVDKTITVIDDSQPAATAVIATILTPGGTPEHVDADRSNGMIYVAEQTGITVIDGNTNTIRTFIADTPASPHQVAFHPGRGLLYFTNSGSRTITGTRP